MGELEAAALISGDGWGVGDFGGLDEAAGDGGAEVADVAADVDGAVGGFGVVENAHGLGTLETGFGEGFDGLFEAFLFGEGSGELRGAAGGP